MVWYVAFVVKMIISEIMKDKIHTTRVDSLWAHLTGSGSESSLPEVSSVVASGRIVVISIGMESTAPSATTRQPRNFSISPKK